MKIPLCISINTQYSNERSVLRYLLDPEPLGRLSTELVAGKASFLLSPVSAAVEAGDGCRGFEPDDLNLDIFFCTSCLNPRMRPTKETPPLRAESPFCKIK